LKAAQSRQKSYADLKRRPITFNVGDFVYLRVTPLKGMQRFHVKGKLVPWYIGPFKIFDRKGAMSYKLELPQSYPISMMSSMCRNSANVSKSLTSPRPSRRSITTPLI
jgi:hypothetical protein